MRGNSTCRNSFLLILANTLIFSRLANRGHNFARYSITTYLIPTFAPLQHLPNTYL
nr:MAG TPA: hypothetical protein [Caudoviricetes sp.]